MRPSFGLTCWAMAKFGLSKASRASAETPAAAYLPADFRNSRRGITPCTYWSNSDITSGAKSLAVRRFMSASPVVMGRHGAVAAYGSAKAACPVQSGVAGLELVFQPRNTKGDHERPLAAS